MKSIEEMAFEILKLVVSENGDYDDGTGEEIIEYSINLAFKFKERFEILYEETKEKAVDKCVREPPGHSELTAEIVEAHDFRPMEFKDSSI